MDPKKLIEEERIAPLKTHPGIAGEGDASSEFPEGSPFRKPFFSDELLAEVRQMALAKMAFPAMAVGPAAEVVYSRAVGQAPFRLARAGHDAVDATAFAWSVFNLANDAGNSPHHDAEESPPQRIAVRYRNWRGSTRLREVEPIRIVWGKTKWHKQDQWLLKALDPEDNKEKLFALRDCDFLSHHQSEDLPVTFRPLWEDAALCGNRVDALRQRNDHLFQRAHMATLGRRRNLEWEEHTLRGLYEAYRFLTETFDADVCQELDRHGNGRPRDSTEGNMCQRHAQFARLYIEARAALLGLPGDMVFDAFYRRSESHRDMRVGEGHTLNIFGFTFHVQRRPRHRPAWNRSGKNT